MFYFMLYLKFKGFGKYCVLVIDGCFSGGISGLFIGYCLFEVVSGGGIGLVEDGDKIEIDILNCSINIVISDEEFLVWRVKMEVSEKFWCLKNCVCEVFILLKIFVVLVISVDKGVVCDVMKLENLWLLVIMII